MVEREEDMNKERQKESLEIVKLNTASLTQKLFFLTVRGLLVLMQIQ